MSKLLFSLEAKNSLTAVTFKKEISMFVVFFFMFTLGIYKEHNQITKKLKDRLFGTVHVREKSNSYHWFLVANSEKV